MSTPTTDSSRDWLGSMHTNSFAWWPPHAAILAGLFVPVTVRAVIWIIGLVWLGAACILNFVRQYAQLGLNKRIPLLSASTSDGITLAVQGAAALDEVTGSFWGPDFENPASRKFVSEFEAKFKRTPSQYAAQSYDAALLLDSAIAKIKGNLSDKKAFQAALKQADFESVRGSFKFK